MDNGAHSCPQISGTPKDGEEVMFVSFKVRRADLLERTLMLGGIGGRRRRGRQRMSDHGVRRILFATALS